MNPSTTTSAVDRPSPAPRAVQTPRSVARAEVAKLLAPGGVRGWVTVALVLGVVAGVGTVLLALVAEVQEILGMTVADTLSTGPMVVMLALGIAAANYVSREVSDGTVVTAKYLVPNVRTLFVGRLLGWTVLSAAVSAATAVVVLPLAVVVPAVEASRVLTTLVALVLGVLVPAVTVVLVHAGAILLRRGAYIVAVGITVLVVIPLVAAVGQVMLTGPAASAAKAVSAAMVGPLALNAMAVPTGDDGSWLTTGASLLGLLAWLGVAAALAFSSFRRSGYGE